MFKKFISQDGLRVISVPVENAKSVAILVLVGTGSKCETKEINGISHFLEHMFFKGTKKRPNTLAISEALDRVGGEYNAFTSKEITGFWAKADKKHFNLLLDWISDIFLNSKFEEEEIEREKGVIIEELNMYLDTPTAYVSELFEKLLYGDQPAGWRIIGEKENILSFNRKKILEYFNAHYLSENIVIGIGGDIDSGKSFREVIKYFKRVKKGKPKEKEKTREEQKEPQILIHNKKTDQTHLCLGVRTFNIFDKRRYPLALLSVILGGNMSSRLFISVRERNGLAYYIHTSSEANSGSGYLVTQAGIKNEALEKGINLILKEYQDIKEKGVSKSELQKAKDYLRGKMTLALETTDAQVSFYAIQEATKREILTSEQELREIDKVSGNDIKKVAKEIFLPEKLNLALIGPWEEKDKEKLEKILKI